MADLELVLVDSSVWIRFFRVEGSAEARVLDTLLALGPVATCAPIRAEVVSGARTTREFNQLRGLFAALVDLDPPRGTWHRIEEHRFTLARRGYQASIIDVMIALTAEAHHAALWTLDKDFIRLSTVIPFDAFQSHQLER